MASGPTAGSHPGVPDRWFNLRGFGNPVCCSWGPADYDSATNTITVTYQITEGSGAPPGAKGAAEAGVQAWITAINSREDATWHFNLEPFTGAGPSGLGSLHWILSCHRGGKDGKGCGEPPPNGGNRDEPDINIKIKKGGATIAGSAKRFADNQGFIKKVNITVSGAFAFIPTPLAQIEEVTAHEVGHALGMGHHTNEQDHMGQTVGYEGGGPSACDLDGFEAAHQWLVDGGPPDSNPVNSVTC